MPPRRRIMPLVLGLPVRQAYAFTGICSSIPKNLRFFGSPVSAAQVFSSFPKSLTTFREPCAAHWNGLRSVPIFVCAKISHPLRRRIMPLVLGLPVRQAYAFTGICSSIPKSLTTFREPCPPRRSGRLLRLCKRRNASTAGCRRQHVRRAAAGMLLIIPYNLYPHIGVSIDRHVDDGAQRGGELFQRQSLYQKPLFFIYTES